ncbi:MAG: acyl--CoA ligase [Rubrivivax sp.]|nr:acyl--CoA ligase [Rubrivivax sp.]
MNTDSQPPTEPAAFSDIASRVRDHARQAPRRTALVCGDEAIDYATLDARMDAVVAALQRDGLGPGDAVAICAPTSVAYAVVFLGALRAGLSVAPLAPGSTAASLQRMAADADARLLYTAEGIDLGGGGPTRIALDGSSAGRPLADWLGGAGAPEPVAIAPEWPFNIIYSSGTTGEPKGIVQAHAMRWAYAERAARFGYGADTVALLSTPLYSNTTLVVFFPALTYGGTVVLMPKFDAVGWLALAERHRATHAMLVPVQYERLLARPEFDRTDLSSFRYKFSTSAPFRADVKADALRRWPGGLVEFYGMTEGGGSCILEAHLHPDKLHTVGQPAPGHDILLIDEEGREVPQGEAGEVVGRSGGMMSGYHKKPEATRAAEWFDAEGRRYIRTGDVGRFDADGFLVLLDRRKDLVISGGFNVYPSDLEAVLREHPGVADVAVVGVPSVQWGETPVAAVVWREGAVPAEADAAALLAWANARLGKTQRLAAVHSVEALPRSAIGKVLKRELRDALAAGHRGS